MKSRRSWILWISLTLLIMCIIYLESYCRDMARLNHLLLAQDSMDALRAQEVSLELYETFVEWGSTNERGYSCYDYLAIYLMTGEAVQGRIHWYLEKIENYKPREFGIFTDYLQAVWEDLKYFPVPASRVNEEADVSFVDSWMFARTFGGKRGHEGTDLMADINERGRYPVVSITDGVVEKIGWLPQGGYRLGIRSPSGGYFYYAHLYDYARDFQPGDVITAGEWIGFMGDSGYSQVEGTVGNFAVHLHLGIYVNAPDGTEISINSYWPLKMLETQKLQYTFY